MRFSIATWTFIPTIIILGFLLGRYHIDIGFALKPFMIISGLIFMLLLVDSRVRFSVANYDILFVFLILYGGFTVLVAPDIVAGIRLFILAILVFCCYKIIEAYMIEKEFSSEQVGTIIRSAAWIFNLLSLGLYLIGVSLILSNYRDFGGQDVLGVTVDRNMIRLIGATSDPNFYVMHNIPFLFYLIYQGKGIRDLALTLLILGTIILTFSRGGILAIALPFIALSARVFYRSRMRRQVFYLIAFAALLIIGFSIIYWEPLVRVFQQRTSDLGSGSGRFHLISIMLGIFSEHPLAGVGWHNFRYYNQQITGDYHYGHNTYLELLAELGVIGFILYSLFLFFIFDRVRKTVKRDRALSFFIPCFFAFLISMFFLSSVVNEVFFLFLAMIGFLSKIREQASRAIDNEPGQ